MELLDAVIKLRSHGELEILERLINAARMLTEPSEPNGEYIRGQANLIVDTIIWSDELPADEATEIVTRCIRHEISFWTMLGELLDRA